MARLVMAVAVVAALLAAPLTGAALDTEEKDKESAALQLDAGDLEVLLRQAAAAADGLVLPYLPTIAANGLSLSLTRLRLPGVTNVKVADLDVVTTYVNASLLFPSVSLISEVYIAGGMIDRLPFVGESWANITFVNLTVNGFYEKKNALSLCAKPNSTSIRLAIDRLIVNFNELNPGPDHQDSGILINAMLSNLGKDIIEWLTLLFNDEQALHPLMDKLVLKLLDSVLPGNCNTGFNGPLSPPTGEEPNVGGIPAGERSDELADQQVPYFDAEDEEQDGEGLFEVPVDDDDVMDVSAVYQQVLSLILGEVGGLQEMSPMWQRALESFPSLNWPNSLE